MRLGSEHIAIVQRSLMFARLHLYLRQIRCLSMLGIQVFITQLAGSRVYSDLIDLSDTMNRTWILGDFKRVWNLRAVTRRA